MRKISTRLFDILFQFGYFSGSGGRQTRLTFTSVTKQHSARTRRGLKNRLGDVSNQRADEDKAASLPSYLLAQVGSRWDGAEDGYIFVEGRHLSKLFPNDTNSIRRRKKSAKTLRGFCSLFLPVGARKGGVSVRKVAPFGSEKLRPLGQKDCTVCAGKIVPFESERLLCLSQKDCAV